VTFPQPFPNLFSTGAIAEKCFGRFEAAVKSRGEFRGGQLKSQKQLWLISGCCTYKAIKRALLAPSRTRGAKQPLFLCIELRHTLSLSLLDFLHAKL
jgi:hypothetical protein